MTTTSVHPEQSAPPDKGAARGDRFVSGTLLTLAGLLVGYQGLATAIIPPLAVFAVLFAVVGLVVRRRRSRWLLMAAGAVGVLYLLGSFPFMAENLSHPASPASFLGESFIVIGLGALLVGVVTGLRGAGPGDRRSITVGAGVLAALAVAVSTLATLNIDRHDLQPDDVPIEVVRSRFPDDVVLPAGAATLWVDNKDLFHHTIVIEDIGVRAELPGASSVRVPVDLEPGTYRFFCDVPGHESMEGELDVR